MRFLLIPLYLSFFISLSLSPLVSLVWLLYIFLLVFWSRLLEGRKEKNLFQITSSGVLSSYMLL